jgi:hypothetical protein
MRHDETVISGLYLQYKQMIVIAINTIITIDMICVNIIDCFAIK